MSDQKGRKVQGKTIREHAAKAGMSWATLNARLRRGWSLRRATTTPVRAWVSGDDRRETW